MKNSKLTFAVLLLSLLGLSESHELIVRDDAAVAPFKVDVKRFDVTSLILFFLYTVFVVVGTCMCKATCRRSMARDRGENDVYVKFRGNRDLYLRHGRALDVIHLDKDCEYARKLRDPVDKRVCRFCSRDAELNLERLEEKKRG